MSTTERGAHRECQAYDTEVIAAIGSYVSGMGGRREVVVLRGASATRLVVDRAEDGDADPRLVAHLAADEPDINAELVGRMYLEHEHGRYCRRLRPDDLLARPLGPRPASSSGGWSARALPSRPGIHYRLAEVRGCCREIPELRWVRDAVAGTRHVAEVVSLRSVIGELESYEPARAMADAAVAAHRLDPGISVVVLRAELDRLATSPIILNRLLREAVIRAVAAGLTLSTIAMRCGRTKRDQRGNVSGETSWLGRRLGLLPEGGNTRPTPWIHSDVLAVIARRGLGVCPREVELS